MRRRRIVERDEVLPAPAHIRLAVWRDAQTAAHVPDQGPVLASIRAVLDAQRDAETARLRAEQAALRRRLEVVIDQQYARAVAAQEERCARSA